MADTSLQSTDTTETKVPFEQRVELDKLIKRIQDARNTLKQYTLKGSKLDKNTLSHLKTISNQLQYFKRDLSNYLNPTTKQKPIINNPTDTKQTKLTDSL